MAQKERDMLWLRLDNAAKIFPASLRPGWSNVFRLSVTFVHPVDPVVLQQALDRVCPRFPSVCVRLRRGLFWYYLEQNASAPRVTKEGCQPLLPMTRRQIGKCALRVLYYENRVAVEFFHALTDGTGATFFLKTLAAEYLRLKEGVAIPPECGILSLEEEVSKEELEDAFLRYAGGRASARDTSSAFSLKGEKEMDGYLHVTCFSIPLTEIKALCQEKNLSQTGLFAAILTESVARIQAERVSPRRERAVRIQIPVNLRRFFPSATLRNFVSVFSVGLEAGEGDFTREEIEHRVRHQMALNLTPRSLRAVFTANVNSEKGLVRPIPLFLKNLVMRAVFDRVGERIACMCLSNLGRQEIPEAMKAYVSRFDFIIGPQSKAPYNCGMICYGDTARLHVVRDTVEPTLERALLTLLQEEGLTVSLESNER